MCLFAGTDAQSNIRSWMFQVNSWSGLQNLTSPFLYAYWVYHIMVLSIRLSIFPKKPFFLHNNSKCFPTFKLKLVIQLAHRPPRKGNHFGVVTLIFKVTDVAKVKFGLAFPFWGNGPMIPHLAVFLFFVVIGKVISSIYKSHCSSIGSSHFRFKEMGVHLQWYLFIWER